MSVFELCGRHGGKFGPVSVFLGSRIDGRCRPKSITRVIVVMRPSLVPGLSQFYPRGCDRFRGKIVLARAQTRQSRPASPILETQDVGHP